MSVKKTFRFDEEMANDLVLLSDVWRVDQTEAVRRALRYAAQNPENRTAERYAGNDEGHTDSQAPTVRIAELEAIVRELRETVAFDRELLLNQTTALNTMAGATAQAQALHAADKVETLPTTTAGEGSTEPRGLFRRIGEKIRGRG